MKQTNLHVKQHKKPKKFLIAKANLRKNRNIFGKKHKKPHSHKEIYHLAFIPNHQPCKQLYDKGPEGYR